MFGNTQRLIGRCIQKEERAWQEFIEHFSGLLYYSARERLKRDGIRFVQEDLDDIVQGVFLEMWEKNRLQEVRDRERINAWLSIVAQSRALNYIRQKKERLLSQKEFYKIDNIVSDAGSYVDERLLDKLERIVQNFDAREKLILKLNIIYGKKHKEIAEFMNIPINTVSTIIARKKNFLRERLKDFVV